MGGRTSPTFKIPLNKFSYIQNRMIQNGGRKSIGSANKFLGGHSNLSELAKRN